MIFEALALGSLLLLVNGGHSPRTAARIVGRFAGSSAATLRRIRAEAESQILKQSERAESAISKGEGIENQRKRMERLRAVQAEASSLVQLLSTPPTSFSRPSFDTSPSLSTTDVRSTDSASTSTSTTASALTNTSIITTVTSNPNSYPPNSQDVDPKSMSNQTTSRLSTASKVQSLIELERKFLR